MKDQHAVFAVLDEFNLVKVRITDWIDWRAAQDRWTELDDARRAGTGPADIKFYAVRSADDDDWRGVPTLDEVKRAKVNAARPESHFPNRKSYRKMPEVYGFTRIPDEPDVWQPCRGGWCHFDGCNRRDDHGHWIPGRRMLRCDTCGTEIASLGVGYHRGNKRCNDLMRNGYERKDPS